MRGRIVAACVGVLLATGPAPAQVSTRAQLVVNFSYSASYSRKFEHADVHASTTENMSLRGTLRRNYMITVQNGQLTDLRELTPAEAKKMSAPAATGSGSMQYNGFDTSSDKNGLISTAKISSSGTIGNDAMSASLFATDAGMTLRTQVHATNISGSCTFNSKNANSAACNAVPLAGMVPDAKWVSANTGTYDWSADFQQKPSGGLTMPDPYTNFVIGTITNALQVRPGQGGNSSYSFNQSWQFEKNDASDGDRAGKRTITASATLEAGNIQCTLTNAMMQTAFSTMKSYEGDNVPMRNFQTHSTGANAMSFSFSEPAVANNYIGFTVTGTATLSNGYFRVKASLTRTGASKASESAIGEGGGCIAGDTNAAGLNAAFALAVNDLIEGL